MLDDETVVIPSPHSMHDQDSEPSPFPNSGSDSDGEGGLDLPTDAGGDVPPAPKAMKDEIKPDAADPKSPSDVTKQLPPPVFQSPASRPVSSPVKRAPKPVIKGAVPPVTGPVEMPNLQVSYEAAESKWLFNEVDAARQVFANR